INSLSSSLNTANSSISSLNNNVSNLQKDALQWNGTAYDASHGTANAQKITNVAAGNVTANSTDAVNGGQLYSLSSSTVTGLDNLSTAFSGNLSTGLSTANSRIDTVSQSTTTLAGNLATAISSISTLQKDALQWNGTAYDASHGTANAQKIVKVAAGDVSENSTDAVNAGQLFSLSSSTSTSLDSLSTTLHNAGDLSNVNNSISSLNNTVSNLQKDALQWNGTAYDASHGTANAQKITNVAAGNVTANSTDAVNGGQLYSLSSSTVTGLDNLSTAFSGNLSTGLSTANSRIDTVSQSTTTLAGNLATAISSISTLQKDALQWNGTAYDASHGTANAQRIINVANGNIGENSTDAINGGQLYSISSSIFSSVSSSVENVVNENKINMEAVNRDLRTAQTALQTAQNDIQTAQTDIQTSKKLIEELQKNAVHFDDDDAGSSSFFGLTRDTSNERTISNIANGRVDATSNQAVNGRQLYALSTSTSTSLSSLQDQLNLASGNIPAGLSTSLSTLLTDALQWNGNAYDASHHSGSPQKITNLAIGDIGEHSTDAVNGSQLWQMKNDFKQDLQSLSTSTANALSKVAESLGGNASYDDPVTRAGTGGNFTPPNYISSTADGTEVIVHNVGNALSNLYNGGSKYAKVNSTLSAASASGNNAIAIGGAAAASGNAAVAIGAEAKASVADGVAIGNHASVTQSGGIALGANSVANTAGGIMGYIPVGATAQQARAIQATTSTEAAVSVGDASKGIYRQITGVAAGTEDTDAVNVAQLKGVNARIENINRYVNNVNDRIQHVERRAYSGTALAMALSGAYLPQLNAGEQTVGVGMGSYHGYTAVGINYKATNNSGKFSWGAGVSTTGHETGFNAGIGYKW
ncbi:YadA family autotransporter adhesin, partial [Snodgrassella gandavensis]|uniref:YadA family autotransporter adhesin n=1 Tax=Snodgrassella gandavensis TaxID=2946698 RepID=UPI001EF44A98